MWPLNLQRTYNCALYSLVTTTVIIIHYTLLFYPGDSFSYQEIGNFSTPDRDSSNWSCPKFWGGSWWFGRNGCHLGYLNGPYLPGQLQVHWRGIIWYTWKGFDYSLKFSEMKFRKYQPWTAWYRVWACRGKMTLSTMTGGGGCVVLLTLID